MYARTTGIVQVGSKSPVVQVFIGYIINDNNVSLKCKGIFHFEEAHFVFPYGQFILICHYDIMYLEN